MDASELDAYAHLRDPQREPLALLQATRAQWGGRTDLWVFGYASLIWNPGFAYSEQRLARIWGHHRALKMWSRINRGTPQVPGLVFALLSGGSCRGLVYRVPRAQGDAVLHELWLREMPTAVYDPVWLHCQTTRGSVRALAFVLPRSSSNYTGELKEEQYRHIFAHASGRYGSTRDYALRTHQALLAHGIRDQALARLLNVSQAL